MEPECCLHACYLSAQAIKPHYFSRLEWLSALSTHSVPFQHIATWLMCVWTCSGRCGAPVRCCQSRARQPNQKWTAGVFVSQGPSGFFLISWNLLRFWGRICWLHSNNKPFLELFFKGDILFVHAGVAHYIFLMLFVEKSCHDCAPPERQTTGILI